jgi:DNA-binding NarL/FixJ family response regulator
MTKNLFLTRRDIPLPEWKLAFPAAMFRDYPDEHEVLAARGASLIWLHVDHRVKQPAKVIETLHRVAPDCPVVVLANVPRDNEGLAVLEAGAAGYTGALAVSSVLRQIATVVANGGLWVGPRLMQRLLVGIGRHSGLRPEAGDRLGRLSRREREVALAVAAVATNKEVARQLDITERTVKAHLSRVFELLAVRDRLQLAILVNGLPTAQVKAVH